MFSSNGTGQKRRWYDSVALTLTQCVVLGLKLLQYIWSTLMSYKKVRYPLVFNVFSFPNHPLIPGALPSGVLKGRIMYYPKFTTGLGAVGFDDLTPIVIIAFPLDVALRPSSAAGLDGDILYPNTVVSRPYQVLRFAHHALGFPNETFLATAAQGINWSVGPP